MTLNAVGGSDTTYSQDFLVKYTQFLVDNKIAVQGAGSDWRIVGSGVAMDLPTSQVFHSRIDAYTALVQAILSTPELRNAVAA